jgi:hypothetical protein
VTTVALFESLRATGIMAVLGAPVALEDAPLPACRAALLIPKRLKAAGPEFEARHGVATAHAN